MCFDFATGTVHGYWADELSDLDVARFGAARGDPAWQTEWEMLAVLISLEVWKAKLVNSKVAIQTDNTATMYAALHLKSGKAIMNAMAGEISLRIDRARATIDLVEHIPGLLNYVADALSRLTAGKKLPEVLSAAPRFQALVRSADFWTCWPQEL